MTLPGARLVLLAQRVIDRRTMMRLVEPAIADLRHEYQDASHQPGQWPRRRALVRGYVSLMRIAPAVAFGCLQRGASGFAREDDGLLGQLLLITGVAAAVLTALLALPASRFHIGHAPLLLALVVPQALAVGLPLGWLVGTLVALRERPMLRSRVAAARLAVVTLVVCVCTLLTTGWLVPAANQRFRVVVATTLASRDGRPVPVNLAPGANEMTFAELSRRIALWAATPEHAAEVNRLRWTITSASRWPPRRSRC